MVSRLTHFLPGYLYGVLGGAVFVGVLERRREGRVETFTLAAGLVTALVAWVIFEPVARAANETDASLGVLVADAVLACLFIGGIEGLLFSLIPLRFLPGSRVRQWGWAAVGTADTGRLPTCSSTCCSPPRPATSAGPPRCR